MKKTARGFTLVELLVVIAIIAILAAVVILIINPLELMKRSRDANRLVDLQQLETAINVAVQDSTAAGTAIACNGVAGDCGGTNGGRSNEGTRVTNGTGWVKVNLGSQKSVSVPTLSIDPVNTSVLHYTYCGNGEKWKIETKLESDQNKIDKETMKKDGGIDDNLYERGSDLSIDCTY